MTQSPSTPAQFKAVRPTRAFDEIATQIRVELAEGRLAIGSRLPSERALAEQFGVARNTLREALRSLEHAGLIRMQKGATGGAFINDSKGEAITTGLLDLYHLGAIAPAQLTEARIWLEGVIVRVACQRATDKDIEELNRNIDAAEEATLQGDFERRSRHHLEFHQILARMTGNPIFVVVMEGVLDVLHHFIMTLGEYENASVLPSRRRFMKHLIARDADAAVAEMEANMKRLQRIYLSRYEDATQDAAKKAVAGNPLKRKPRQSPEKKS